MRSKGGSSDGRRASLMSPPAGGRGTTHARAEKGNASGRHGDKAGADEMLDKLPFGAKLPTDLQLKNKVEVLRSAGRLHVAGVQDIFRFGADVTAPGSMVLGLADSCGIWGSDASELTKFHNGAMRKVAPSSLKVLPVPQ